MRIPTHNVPPVGALLLPVLLLAAAACSPKTTYPPPLPPALAAADFEPPRAGDEERTKAFEQAYYELLDRHTQRVRGYKDRVDTPVAYWVSYLSWPLTLAELRARGMRRLWTHEQWERARTAAAKEHRQNLLFRLDFYTERPDENQISNSPASPWRVFLVLPDGTRLEPGRIRQLTGSESELAWLSPHHSRYAQMYELEFERSQGLALDPDAAARLEVTGLADTSLTLWHLGRDLGPGDLPTAPR